VSGGEVADGRGQHRGPRPCGPVLERYDDRRDQGHQDGRGQRRQPPPVRPGGPPPPQDVAHDRDEDRYGDLDVAEVGEEPAEPVRLDEDPAEAGVQAQQRAVDHDLPGDQGEDDGRDAEEQGAAG
jgi:hypothetical protein